ncbi:hypothetical protein BAE44_0019886 [Dichanthelium oligosanthes]|uniref:VTT domain-containing protein n=1 Tax=Dichanthelium oligosanthes TaxID=888268 RepID=A0A1E5V1Z6_9POAL|nr:hypothetical protein BAE44_0019886 [Dichanthelium oligosanthes]
MAQAVSAEAREASRSRTARWSAVSPRRTSRRSRAAATEDTRRASRVASAVVRTRDGIRFLSTTLPTIGDYTLSPLPKALQHQVVAPILYWESTTFSRPAIALICFGAIALFPSVLIPSSPFMWVAGMNFGYFYGFLIITAGMSIGMSLPYFIGSAFHCRIHRWLEKWPKKAAFVRLAGEGDWHHQFKAVALLRISPFPYIVFNYASVATNVKYCPYIAGSMAGTIHETFLAIYSGKLLQSLAVATSKGSFLSVDQIIYNGIGFTIAAASTAAITIYAKKALHKLQAEDEIF